MAQQRNFWIPVICGAIILTIGIGARQSFGIFRSRSPRILMSAASYVVQQRACPVIDGRVRAVRG